MKKKIFTGAIVAFIIITIGVVIYFSPKGFSQDVPSDTGTSTTDISTDLSISSITMAKKGGSKSNLTIGLANVAPADLWVPIKAIFNAKAAEALTTLPVAETGVSVTSTTPTHTFLVNNGAFCSNAKGTSTVTVVLDINEETPETNEENNIKTLVMSDCSKPNYGGIYDGYPPLWIYGKGVVDLAVIPPLTVKKKNATSYTWTANFKNTALKNSKMDMNVLFNMNAQTGTSSKKFTIPTAAKTVVQPVLIKTICPNITGTSTPAGTSTITIELDPSDKIKEINETNNVFGFAFNCTTLGGYYFNGYPTPYTYGIIPVPETTPSETDTPPQS